MSDLEKEPVKEPVKEPEMSFIQRIQQITLAMAESKKSRFDMNVKSLSEYFNDVAERMIADKVTVQELVISQTKNNTRTVLVGIKICKDEGPEDSIGKLGKHYWHFEEGEMETGILRALEQSDLLKKLQIGLEHEGFDIKIVQCLSPYYRLQLRW